MKRLITLETAMSASSNRDELQDMINRGVGVVAGAGLGRHGPAPTAGGGRAVEVSGLGSGAGSDVWRHFAYSGRTRGGRDGQRRARGRHDGRRGRGAAPRADPRHAHHAGQGARPRRRRRKAKAAGKTGKKVAAKNLAVFTRQFSVMIDAGLPLVQCLDILGSQEEDKNFAAVILQTRTDVEVGRVAGRRDAASTRRRSTRSSPT